MICKQRRQELGSWQNAKSKGNPAKDKWPLAKLKGIYFNKSCSFVGTNKSVGRIIEDKALFIYSAVTSKRHELL